MRVYVLDLLPTVPYYTGYLCAALKGEENLQVVVGSPTYWLDEGFFERRQVRRDGGLLNVGWRLRRLRPAIRRLFKLTEYLCNLLSLLFRFSLHKPDVLHVQFLPLVEQGLPVEFWFLRFVQARGVHIVHTVHNVLPQDTGEKHRAAFQRVYRLSDRLICHGESARLRLTQEFGIDNKRISVIPHGPLHEPGSAAGGLQLRERLGIHADECFFLCQGILRPYKGVPFLLEAWSRAGFENGRARLAIVGNGTPEIVNEIRAQVASLGLRDTVLLDFRFVSLKELADYQNAADVLVYPYREITTSGALMTGVRYGKAILATEHPVFHEILRHGENALMAPYGDAHQFALELTHLGADAGLRRRLGQAAREAYSNHPEWPAIARRTEACYRAAIGAI